LASLLFERVVVEGRERPSPRGWMPLAALGSAGDGSSITFLLFGGLGGDDDKAARLGDVWLLTLPK
jgi:hypothetical protein